MVKASRIDSDHDTFEGVIVSKEDFTNFDEYNILSKSQKEHVWTYAKKKMPDMLLQDYGILIEACIENSKDSMEYYDLQEPQDVKDESYYEHMNHQKLNEDV